MMLNNHSSNIALILDDHKFFGEAIAVMLEHNGFVDAAYSYTDPVDIRKQIIQHREGNIYFFLDYHIPDVNVLQLMNDVRRLSPSIRVIMLTSLSNSQVAKKIITYNPEGFLSKTAGIDELADCFHCLKKKQTYISPYIQSLLDVAHEKSLFGDFTAKEIEVLHRLVKGDNIEEMAKSLNLSRNTIIAHRRNMLAKAGLKSVIALLAKAIEQGLIPNSN